MKQGRHVRIPDGPHDLRRLWTEATPLDDADLPGWLTPEDAADYRCLGRLTLAGLSPAEVERLEEEFGELELARLIVDADPRDPLARRLYIGRPRPEPVWSIGIARGTAAWSPWEPMPGPPALAAAQVNDVPATSVADPFLLWHDGRWFMFFEVVNWKTWKGEIGLATSADGASWRYESIVLTEPFHLSYPYVFRDGDGIFMIPETSQDGSVRLYRARRFPWDWEHVGDLLRGAAFADASILRHEGRWWLFVETSGGRNDTLRLYHAAMLEGPWQEHPHSPVVRDDAENARPAGRIVAADGRLLRFAQNCGPAYGTDVRVREIVRLTPQEYEERPHGPGPVLGPAAESEAANGSMAPGGDPDGTTATAWNAGGMHHVDPVHLGEGRWLAAVDGWRMDDEPAVSASRRA